MKPWTVCLEPRSTLSIPMATNQIMPSTTKATAMSSKRYQRSLKYHLPVHSILDRTQTAEQRPGSASWAASAPSSAPSAGSIGMPARHLPCNTAIC